MQRIAAGVRLFQTKIFPKRQPFFARLAGSQSPETLFITCADSRIVPNLITHTGPGEMFVERNPGNLIPPYNNDSAGELASIEYAVAALGVKHIIVCGHSDCGAMKGLLNPKAVESMPAVARWLEHGKPALKDVHATDEDQRLIEVTHANVHVQIDNLKGHPSVAARIQSGEVDIHGWVYDIKTGRIDAWDDERGEFRSWPD